MTAIRETCPCGAKISIRHPDPAPIAAEWRGSHLCDRRAEREVVSGAVAEIAHTEPHRTDSDLGQRIGFTPPPPGGVWVTHRHDGTGLAAHPDQATARRATRTDPTVGAQFLPYGAFLTDIIRSARRPA